MKLWKVFFLSFLLGALDVSIFAQSTSPPVITQSPSGKSIREEDIANLFIAASDPDTPGNELIYSWSIASDPTGNAFFRLTDGSEVSTAVGNSSVRLGLRAGANYPGPTYVGQEIMLRAEVSDGTDAVSVDVPVTVAGVNQRPTLTVNPSQLGTRENPRLTNQGLGLDARASVDPDGNEVKVLWKIVGVGGGQVCTGALVLFGKETLTPGLSVPQVSARPDNPMTIVLEAYVEDGLISFSQNFTGYMASTNGCSSGAPAPVVNAVSASPTLASYGQLVTLRADAPSGLNYSWVQLDTTGNANTVTLSGANSRTATFTAPSISTTLTFRFTVSDTQNRTDSRTITVQVVPSGGGGGGGGGNASGDTGTPSGTATGQSVCNQSNNTPAQATVPAQFTIEGGNVARIRASNGRDPDNTQVFVNGVVASGVSYQWSVVNGAGLITSASLSGAMTEEVSVNTPTVSQNQTATLAMTINDAAACGTSYQVQLVLTPVQNQTPNLPPDARMVFQLSGDPNSDEAVGQTVTLSSPAEVTLDAGSSVDPDGTLTYAFTLQQNLLRGGAVLSQISESARRLVIQADTEGTVRVTMTVTDNRGATDSVSVLFVIEDITAIPLAMGGAVVNGVLLQPGDAVEEGVVVMLDGSESALPDGSQPSSITYSWRQVSGPPVNVLDADKAQALFRAPEVISGAETIVFELIVRNGNVASNPLELGVTVEVPPVYFSQVAFGPLRDERFRTTIVLINNNDIDAEGITIEFFNPQGQPLNVQLDGEPWDPTEAFSIESSSSIMLSFRALDENLTVGWGRVNSDVRLTGLVLYQLVDAISEELNSEVSLFSSRRGSRFTTFYGASDGLAIALANPGVTEARVNVKIIDPLLGPDLPLATRPLVLQPGQHLARFLNESYFGQLPDEFVSGTLVVEAVRGRVIATVLKTQSGVAISTLPLAVRR